MYILVGLTAGNAAGYRGGVKKTGIEDILVLPAVRLSPFSLVPHFVTDSRMFWVFKSLFLRRCGVFLASCCGSGSRISPDVAASPVLAVAAAATSRRLVWHRVFYLPKVRLDTKLCPSCRPRSSRY